MSSKKHFKTGFLFFISSFIIGYGGAAIFGAVYIWTENKFWLWTGSGVYGFSWLLFGIGFGLTGKKGLKYFTRKNNEI